MKIQIKIALLFTLFGTMVIVALSCAIYYLANSKAFQDFYVRLELRATIAAKAYLDSNRVNSATYEQVRREHLQRLPEEKEYIVRIDSLPYLAQTGLGADVPPKFFNDIVTGQKAAYRRGQQFYYGIYYSNDRSNYVIIIAAEHPYAVNFLSNLQTILIIANIAAMILLFTIGLFFSRNITGPIRRITHEVKAISATSLNRRLAIREGDEIAELAETFNNMLSRLETSFETQNNFVSNASHELNTPLTSIIGEAEYALSRPRTTEQYVAGMQVVLSQAEKLKNITRSLLELAQSGFTGNLSSETVEVSTLLDNVIHVTRNIYPDCRLQIDNSLKPDDYRALMILGNFHLLELCISNILLNACKYSGGNTVTLALAASHQHVVLIVRDEGIGIPAADMPHIFDPFFRASNTGTSKGYGIGLPLAQNIIRLHKGTIHISSREREGTEVVLRIPRKNNH